MWRERTLKIVLAVLGLVFCAAVYPLVLFLKAEPSLSMMMSLYATLGIFLLVAVRNPSGHRSLIAFAAWSSFAHAGVMAVQAYRGFIGRQEVVGVLVFAVIGVILIVLTPAKQPVEREAAAVTSRPAF